MSDIRLNPDQFFARATRLTAFFPTPIIFMLSKSEDFQNFGLNSAGFLHLLNYEFPESFIILQNGITNNNATNNNTETNAPEIIFITTPRKALILEQLHKKHPSIKIIPKPKDDFTYQFLKGVIDPSLTYGVFDTQNAKGRLCEYLFANIKHVDLTNDLLSYFTAKDKEEITAVNNSMKVTKKILDNVVHIIKEGKGNFITCRSVCNTLEPFIDSLSEVNNVDVIYEPCLQAKRYDLTKFETDSGHIDKNVLVRIGMRVNDSCSEIGRNIFLGENEEVIEEYEKLFKARESIYEMFMRADLSAERHSVIQDLMVKIDGAYKNCDGSPSIYSTGTVRCEGLNISQGLCISGMPCYSLTLDLRRSISGVLLNVCESFTITSKFIRLIEKDSCEDYCFEGKMHLKKESRYSQKEVEKNLQRNEHQKELMDALIEDRIEFYKKQTVGVNEISEVKQKFTPYLKETTLPRHEFLYIDKKNFAVLVPVCNYVLPFGIDMIKNASKTDDGVLRINLNPSGTGDMIKTILYKTTLESATDLCTRITELKKDFINRRDMSSNLEGHALILISGRKIVLPEVFMKIDPKMKKMKASSLEMHENGFRYISDSTVVEILFDNIKHLFFQEGTSESRSLIHFHLFEPIFVPKRTLNIQFYRECTVSVQDTSKARDEYYEHALEVEEEQKRIQTNKEFSLYVDRIEEASSLRVEVPLKSNSFSGVPYKGTVLIQPTNSCLVNLTESPSFVLSINEIEVACLERMVFGIKTFDLVLIFKNLQQNVCHIQSIEATHVNRVKDFLDGKNIPFMETKMNLQWNTLFKEILRDPLSFYENGAWSELQPHREDEEESSGVDLNTSSESDSIIQTTSEELESFDDSSAVDESSEEEEEDWEESDESEEKPKKKRNK